MENISQTMQKEADQKMNPESVSFMRSHQVEFAHREFGSVHEAVYGHALKLWKVQERAPPIHGDADADNVGVRRKAATDSQKTCALFLTIEMDWGEKSKPRTGKHHMQ